MAETLSIILSDVAYEWLKRESARSGRTPTEFVTELLTGMADPDNIEIGLIDKLLSGAGAWFPPLMTLEEQDEMRDEVLDFLCHRICEQYKSHVGRPITKAEVKRLRDRLATRATDCWQQR
jgi:hypothetical protein